MILSQAPYFDLVTGIERASLNLFKRAGVGIEMRLRRMELAKNPGGTER